MPLEFDGVNGIIKNTTSDGDVTIKGNDDGSEISALVFDMSATGKATFNSSVFVGNHLYLGDSKKAIFGAGEDLNIYHDGTNSYIQDSGAGDLKIISDGNAISFQKGTSETMAFFDTDAGCELYHNNVAKFVTDAEGGNLTGTLDVSSRVVVAGGTEATTTSDGSIATAGGLSVTKDTVMGDDLKMLSDGAVIHFGANSEIVLTHVHDRGLSISHDGGGDPDLILNNTASASDGNQLGQIFWNGLNSNGDEHTYAFILGQVRDVTDGEEDGQLLIYANKGGTSKQFLTIGANSNAASPDHEVCINEESQNIDFRVESNGNTHMLFVDGGNDHVNIGTSSDLGATFNVKAPDNNTTQQLVLTDNDNQTKTHIGNFSNTTYITNNTHYNGSSWVKDDNAVGTSFIGAGDGSVNFGTSTDATPTVRMTIDSTGAVTMPLQPCFRVGSGTQDNIPVSSNQTAVFSVEIFDIGADFASNTFTAPVTGKYFFTVSFRLNNLDSAASYLQTVLVGSNRNTTLHTLSEIGNHISADTEYSHTGTAILDMDANDTASVQIRIQSGTAQTDVNTDGSYFSGFLIG